MAMPCILVFTHLYGIIGRPTTTAGSLTYVGGPHPQEQRGLGVANGAAELDVRGTVAAHARLGQPR